MAKKDDLKNTMAAALSGLEPVQPEAQEEPKEPEAPKRRRRSAIESTPGVGEVVLSRKQRKPRRRKDPALKKTRTFTLLLTEQLYERFKATAEEQGFSMNGIATRLIKKYVSLHDIDGDDLI